MKRRYKNYFPTINSLVAYYDPYSFFIFLNKVATKDLPDIIANPMTPGNLEHIKTLIHETRHFSDHIGTLWGQKYLNSYLKAINARVSVKLEDFPSIIAYCNSLNQMFYTEYYTEEYNRIEVKNLADRWQWSPTCGLRFNAKGELNSEAPIPFIQFGTQDKRPLIRVPLSITSLLETNATNQEVKIQMGYLLTIPEGPQLVELKLTEKQTLFKLIYNQDLALYNVAVHLTSNLLDIKDVPTAFDISSKVATLTLNLPNEMVRGMLVPKEFEIWGDKTNFMLQNNEYGFIFHLLLFNYRQEFQKDQAFSIDQLLECSGLPKYEEIEKEVLNQMGQIAQEAKGYENLSDLFGMKMDQGRIILQKAGLCFEKENLFKILTDENISTPIICNDTDLPIHIYKKDEVHKMRPISKLTMSEWYNLSGYLQHSLNEFYQIRGV